MKLFVDTSIFVDVLRSGGLESSKSLLNSLQEDNEGYSSVITVAELSVGAYRSLKKDALNKTYDILSIVDLVDLDREIALESGKIYADLMNEGKEIELNDCFIAASSLSLGIKKIVTRNTDHFNRIEDIRALTPEEFGF